MNEEEKAFVCGVACTLVEINRNDIPTVCARVIKSMGYNKKDFNHIKGYDKEHMKPIFKELRLLTPSGRSNLIMRILEETKDYIIYYNIDYVRNCVYLDKPSILYITGHLLDKKTKIEYHAYKKIYNSSNETVLKLGKKLIKRWRREKCHTF